MGEALRYRTKGFGEPMSPVKTEQIPVLPLEQHQRILGELLLERGGEDVLTTETNWQAYCQRQSPEIQSILTGYDRERLKLYEELILNSVQDTMEGMFPYTQKLLGSAWFALAEKYRRDYPNPSFQLFRAVAEFPRFLQTPDRLPESLKPIWEQCPYLSELARYEWLEVDVLNAPDPVVPLHTEPGVPSSTENFGAWAPVWNPVMHFARFKYPILSIIEQLELDTETCDENGHGLVTASGIKAEDIDYETKQPIEVLIYRDPESEQARFFQLNPMTAALVGIWLTPNETLESKALEKYPSYLSGLLALKQTHLQLASIPQETLLTEAQRFFQQCIQEHILVGSRPVGV
ncbi:MAG: DNA-binding domain-containing protein [Cyanobacteria bacterium]|nr:DNA-binding domain-containing protein [Cyanobacteriota bacterium]